MSTTTDERVVKMSLDKEKFTQGVGKVMTTLSTLKGAMDMTQAAKNFNQLDKAANSVSFDGLKNQTSLLQSGIEGVTSKFSALQVAAVTTVVKITDAIENKLMSAVNMVTSGIKSMSVDQISAGWDKYADKTTAVQTIMSATASTWQADANNLSMTSVLKETSDYAGLNEETLSAMVEMYNNVADGTMTAAQAQKAYNLTAEEFEGISSTLSQSLGYEGTQMDYVNGQLDKLNWFTDETSYSLTDMTNNIGKFTSAGMSLSESVTAMEGISVWASKSGQGVNEASRAMYNLSQSLSMGAVRVEDWASIENANMATLEFKTTAIETAESLGLLKKVSDGVWETTSKAAKAGYEVTAESFRSTLTETKWFTSDVLMDTLTKYGSFTQKLSDVMADEKFEVISTTSEFMSLLDSYEEATDKSKALEDISEKTGIAIADLQPVMEELSKEEYDLGKASFKAAQEAKTFKEAISATQDAVATGWMKSFELIFGNYEQAKVLWTDLANDLWDIFASGATERNSFLEELMGDLGGRNVLLDTYANAMEGLKQIISEVKGVFNEVFPKTTTKEALSLLEAIRSLSEKLIILNDEGEVVSVKFQRIKTILKTVLTVVKNVGGAFGSAVGVIKNLATDIGILWKALFPYSSVDGTLTRVSSKIINLSASIKEFVDKVKDFLDPAKVALAVGKDSYGVIDKLRKVIGFFQNVITGTKNIITLFVDSLKSANDEADKGEKKFSLLSTVIEGLKIFFGNLWSIVKGIIPIISPIFDKIGSFISSAVSQIGTGISNAVKSGKIFEVLSDLLVAGGTGILALSLTQFKGMFSGITKIFSNITGTLSSAGSSISNSFNSITEAMNTMTAQIQVENILTIAKAVAILTASALVLSLIDSDKLYSSINALTGLVVVLGSVVIAMSKAFSSFGTETEGIKGSLDTFVKGNLISKAGTLMVKLAASVLILAVAMKMLSSIDSDSMGYSLAAVSILMLELTAIAAILGTLDIKKMATGFVSMGVALIAAAAAMKIIASIDTKGCIKGVVTIGIVLAELAIAMSLMKTGITGAAALLIASVSLIALAGAVKMFSTIGGGGGALLTIAAALGILAVGLMLMTSALPGAAALLVASVSLIAVATAFKIFSTISGEMGSTIGTIAALLGVLAVGLTLMIHALPGAIALTVFAASLYVLIPALIALGSIPANTIWSALGRIAAIMGVLAATAVLLLPGVLAITAFAVALTVLGASIAVMSLALTALIAAITLFEALGTAAVFNFISKLKILIAGLNDLVPLVLELFTNLVLGLLNLAVRALPKVLYLIKTWLLGVLDILIQAVPRVLVIVGQVITGILLLLTTAVPLFINLVTTTILSLLEAIRILVPEIAYTAVYVVTETMAAVLQALADSIPDLINSGFELILSFINGLADAVDTYAEDINNAIKKLGLAIIGAFCNFFGIGDDGESDEDAPLSEKAKSLMKQVFDGLKNKLDELWESFKGLGARVIEGIKEGIENAKDSLIAKAESVWNSVKDIAQRVFDINSPSKVFAEYGKYLDEGLAIGITKSAAKPIDSTEDMGKGVINSMAKVVSAIQSEMDEDIDYQPQIRPVLDLSEIQNGGSAINSLLNDGISVSANYARKANTSYANSNNSPSDGKSNNFTFTQNNYSPKSLSAIDIYRQTRSQFAQMKGVVNAI